MTTILATRDRMISDSKVTSVILSVLLLAGCATTRQCSVGVMFFGPLPVPTASCELIFEPKGDDV